MIFNKSDAIVAIEAGLPINPTLLTLLKDGLIIKISLFFILYIADYLKIQIWLIQCYAFRVPFPHL